MGGRKYYIAWKESWKNYRIVSRQEADTIMYTVDGYHFLPRDGQSIPEWPPVPEDGWYCLETGRPAVVGIPGAPLSVFG